MKPDPLANLQSLLKRGREISVNAVRAATDAPDAAGKRRKVVILIGGAIFAAAVVIYAATHLLGGDPSERIAIDPTQLVSAIPVSTQEFKQVVVLTGEARPVRDIQVYAPATGVRILQLLADEGDMVRAGQPLARLDTALANAQIARSASQRRGSGAAAIRARGEYERAESIRDSGALSTEAIEQRRAAADRRRCAPCRSARATAETNARLQGGYVRAPAAGLVIERPAELGRPVDGQTLFRIVGDNALEVAAEVAEADMLALRVGQSAKFNLVDGTDHRATLRRGPASIDSRTRTGTGSVRSAAQCACSRRHVLARRSGAAAAPGAGGAAIGGPLRRSPSVCVRRRRRQPRAHAASTSARAKTIRSRSPRARRRARASSAPARRSCRTATWCALWSPHARRESPDAGTVEIELRGRDRLKANDMAFNISAGAIRNPIPPIVLFLALMFAGLTAYFRLPINQFPNVEFPGFTVTVAQPGAAPAKWRRRSRSASKRR